MIFRVDVLLYDKFETLDVFGPVEILGRLKSNFKLNFISINGGIVESVHKVRVETNPYTADNNMSKILLVPGGTGTREMVKDEKFIQLIQNMSSEADYILTVCTGSALLAKTGLLDGKRATSNKMAFNWVMKQREEVQWVKESRWVKDGNIYTSSGVSAGMDMTLGFIEDLMGKEKALEISRYIEYMWNEDSSYDPFSKLFSEA